LTNFSEIIKKGGEEMCGRVEVGSKGGKKKIFLAFQDNRVLCQPEMTESPDS
jgi:hypothetical protein